MDFTAILTFLGTLAPWVGYVLMGLGALVVIGLAVDKIVPDQYDKNFMGKLMNVPILGQILLALCKFSPFTQK